MKSLILSLSFVALIYSQASSASSNGNQTPLRAPISRMNIPEFHSHYTDLQILRAEEITTFFENSTTHFQYAYIENLQDGRGFTAGRVGFCSGTGDLYLVVKSLCSYHPNEGTCNFLPRLKQLADQFAQNWQPVGDTSGLRGFATAWIQDSGTQGMRNAQDRIVNSLYLNPALALAQRVGIQTAIGAAIFYDSSVQHGTDENAGLEGDTLNSLILRALQRKAFSPNDELGWLNTFLDVRREDLLNPYDKDSQVVWAQSVTRVDKLRSIMNDDKNIDLSQPVQFAPGDVTD